MAERNSGPVKPPVIDLKARDTAAEAGRADDGAAPRPPRPLAQLAMPWSAISIAAAGGAVLGTVLTYLIGNAIPLPDNRPVYPDPAPVLAAQAGLIDGLEQKLAALASASEAGQTDTETALTDLRTRLEGASQAVAEQRAALAEIDLKPVDEKLADFEARLSAVAAGASPADASSLTAAMSTLRSEIDSVAGRLGALDLRISAQDATISATKTDIETTKTAIAAQNRTLGGADIAPAVRLPLVVTGLESAFAAGRPYATEVRSLKGLLPNLAVPATVDSAAGTGLPRPDAVVERFRMQLPVILAARSNADTTDLGQGALEWVKGLLAFRPAGEIEGDTPDAIASRLESAIERHDFEGAAKQLASLPEPMRLAAGDVGADILRLAEASRFVASVRAAALEPATEGTP
jgi:hypothetical protein